MIDLRDSNISQYFAITEFNNCFIIGSQSLFLKEYLEETKPSPILTKERSQEEEKRLVSFTHEQNIICSQTKFGAS